MELTAEQLVELLVVVDGIDPPGGNEKRCRPRIGVRDPVKVRPVLGDPRSGQTGRPVMAWLRDVSATGLGITCPHPLEAGQSFVVELPRADGSRLQIRCVVANCATAAPGVYQVGGRFLEPWVEREARAMQMDAAAASR